MSGGRGPGGAAIRPGPLTARAVHDRLLAAYGPQHWWPAASRFEMVVGAVLTQGTAWRNVERAIAALRAGALLAPEVLLAAAPERLAACLRPSGYFNVKSRRLRNLCRWLVDSGGIEGLAGRPTAELRAALLGVDGVGPETADAILLYAFDRPQVVIDAYTRRLWLRLGRATGTERYAELQASIAAELPGEVGLCNEFHALVVCHAKRHCRTRPRCGGCPLGARCALPASPAGGSLTARRGPG